MRCTLSALAFRYARHRSFCSLHTSQSFLSLSNYVRIAHEVLPFTRLAPPLLISVARAAVANAEHMICLAGPAGRSSSVSGTFLKSYPRQTPASLFKALGLYGN